MNGFTGLTVCSIAYLAAGSAILTLASCAYPQQKALSDATARDVAIEQLQAEVSYLKDRQQIHDVYLRYMRGFDRNDVDLMRTAFWPDVQINYGRQSNTFEEFVVRHLNNHTSTQESWGHLLTNESVEVSGDIANVETYVTRLSSGREDTASTIIAGRYIDRVERRDGEWRIAVREFIPYFFTKTDTALDTYIKASTWSSSACGMGTWDRHDPSYQRPLNRRDRGDTGPACAELSTSGSH